MLGGDITSWMLGMASSKGPLEEAIKFLSQLARESSSQQQCRNVTQSTLQPELWISVQLSCCKFRVHYFLWYSFWLQTLFFCQLHDKTLERFWTFVKNSSGPCDCYYQGDYWQNFVAQRDDINTASNLTPPSMEEFLKVALNHWETVNCASWPEDKID
jgi:hypothetical protein